MRWRNLLRQGVQQDCCGHYSATVHHSVVHVCHSMWVSHVPSHVLLLRICTAWWCLCLSSPLDFLASAFWHFVPATVKCDMKMCYDCVWEGESNALVSYVLYTKQQKQTLNQYSCCLKHHGFICTYIRCNRETSSLTRCTGWPLALTKNLSQSLSLMWHGRILS